MRQCDPELLASVAAKFLARRNVALSPAERVEVLRIGQGLSCKDSAQLAGISAETVRARRKRIYRKLQVPGSIELASALLDVSLDLLAAGERIERASDTARTADGASAPVP